MYNVLKLKKSQRKQLRKDPTARLEKITDLKRVIKHLKADIPRLQKNYNTAATTARSFQWELLSAQSYLTSHIAELQSLLNMEVEDVTEKV